MTEIKLKRAYDTPCDSDGIRILVDRLWPRGIRKESARLAFWWKEIAPSNDLRKWFSHDPEKFPEFKRRYKKELDASEEARLCRDKIKDMSGVTLVYAAKDTERNNAAVLEEWLLNR